MDDDKKNESEDGRSPLAGRRFDLAEAIGRENAGALKGASPVARSRQSLAEIEHHLETRLPDPEGSLRRTLLARLEDDAPLLGRHHDRPLAALQELLQLILATDPALESFVRDVDARWGREYQERPYFESGEGPPDPDDPYTLAGVRDLLSEHLHELSAGLDSSS